MQSNKSSKKTHKNAEEAVVGAPELSAAAEVTPKSRLARSTKTMSSKPKKNEAGENTLPKHHHKINSVVTPGTPIASAPAAENTRPVRQVTRQEVAELAHSYWIARNYEHGFAEEDWLRAERELSGTTAAQ
jgi:hypothetical protein